jgi:hypothetical protein
MTDVLNEVRKMQLSEKKYLLEYLNNEISERDDSRHDSLEKREAQFLENLYRKGLLEKTTAVSRNDFKLEPFDRFEISGESLSSSIIRDRERKL